MRLLCSKQSDLIDGFLKSVEENLLFLLATNNTLIYSTLSSPSSMSLSELQLAIFNSKSSAKATCCYGVSFRLQDCPCNFIHKREKRLLAEISISPGCKAVEISISPSRKAVEI